jgi:hypothetical protein
MAKQSVRKRGTTTCLPTTLTEALKWVASASVQESRLTMIEEKYGLRTVDTIYGPISLNIDIGAGPQQTALPDERSSRRVLKKGLPGEIHFVGMRAASLATLLRKQLPEQNRKEFTRLVRSHVVRLQKDIDDYVTFFPRIEKCRDEWMAKVRIDNERTVRRRKMRFIQLINQMVADGSVTEDEMSTWFREALVKSVLEA